jgi:hypothetical protein
MKKIYLKTIFAICVLSVLFVTSGCNDEINDYGIEALNWNMFKAINIGDSLIKFQKKYSKAIRHQFTITENGNIYKYFYIFVASKPAIDKLSSIGLLYKNGELIKFIDPGAIVYKMEEVLYEGTPASRIVSWSINDNYYINNIFNLKPISKKHFKPELTDTTDYNKGMEPLKILPAFAISYILFGAQTVKLKKQYTLNKQFLKEYDSSKINIGMTVKEVEDIYNKPQKIFNLKNNEEVRLYGSSTKLDLVFYRVRYSWFAVVFRSGKVSKVLSNSFFNQDWKKGRNLQKESPLTESVSEK